MHDLTTGPETTAGQGMSREGLLKRLLGIGVLGWLGATLYLIAKYLVPPPVGEANVTSMRVDRLDETWALPFKIIQFGRKPVIIFKDQHADIHALSATCTHLACIGCHIEQDDPFYASAELFPTDVHAKQDWAVKRTTEVILKPETTMRPRTPQRVL